MSKQILNMRYYGICLLAVLLISSGVAFAQSAVLTPVTDIGLHTATVSVPAKYAAAFPAGRTLNIKSGYTVSVFHAGGMIKPRFMAMSPAGVLHVSDMTAGKIWALPDIDNNGIADTITEAASGFSGNHDVKFYKGAMYVTEPTRIWKCRDMDGDGVYETKTIFISNIGNNETSGHTSRTIVFDSVNQKVYVSIGSSCNVCREDHRAIIEQYNDDGTGRRVFASGARNAVGMAMHPVTNRLWTNNNGSDQQGNETPPEWIDVVRDGGFYGHPFVYGSGVWFNFSAHPDYSALLPITAIDSGKVATVVAPAALIRAHTAPMALEFLNSNFGSGMQYGFLTALRGSWNTTMPNDYRGYKVIYGHLSSGYDTTVDYVADFCTGFLTDSVARIFWGRPVGLATDSHGKVYISSDENSKVILVLTPDVPVGVNTVENEMINVGAVYPNPSKNQFTLPLNLGRSASVSVVLYDAADRKVRSLINQALYAAGSYKQQIDVQGLRAGYYFLKITIEGTTTTQKLLVVE